MDPLRLLALRRDPFVHQGLVMVLYDQRYRRFSNDVAMRGWFAYGHGRLPVALAGG